MRTSWGSATDRGHVRALNEDSLLAYPPVFLVADGMGGHAAGDVASRIVVEEFSHLAGRASATPDDVHACFARSAARLREAVQVGSTAGTTVAGAAIAAHEGGAYWLVFNIGDSRVYRWAEGEMEQISVDHSVVQELIDAGEIGPVQARRHPQRNVVTRAVGTETEPDPDYWLIPAGPADRLLICSDGLTSEVHEDVVAGVLRTVPDPQLAAQDLVDRALAAGGRDNVTAVVVDVAVARSAVDTDVTLRAVDRPETSTSQAPGQWDEAVDGVTLPSGTRPEVNP
ncbi:PP2C family protein-serine/threonine phosphatase [Cellulomonas bogoriensis]|uniref:Serine/threonine protein phosphatase n=1 Tax=Cellulomonas bogoriensis 69B4 = DSM 16987 TaxID=1386082 RepID=A0A0A0BTX1_9CELL|nr:protein phosphatase 2C domain-containing protein [Cellulomonas bogoriensis]KGM11843.1 serine/threonine protein phosphatase [Cellulomonas bogoriensis 69B4 = DSM 16987]